MANSQNEIVEVVRVLQAKDTRIAKEKRVKERGRRIRAAIDGQRVATTNYTAAQARLREPQQRLWDAQANLKSFIESHPTRTQQNEATLANLQKRVAKAKEEFEDFQAKALNAGAEIDIANERVTAAVAGGAADVLKEVGITDQDGIDPASSWQVPFGKLQALAEHVAFLELELARQEQRRHELRKELMDWIGARYDHMSRELSDIVRGVSSAAANANVKIAAEVAKRLAE